GQLTPQTQFFDILLFGTIISLMRGCLSSFISGIGRTPVIMLSALTAMSVNVIANYTLVFGKFGFPALGIRGSACGTILGGTCGLLVLVYHFVSRRNREEYNVARALRFSRTMM